MDFSVRNGQSHNSAPAAAAPSSSMGEAPVSHKKYSRFGSSYEGSKSIRLIYLVLLVSIAVLLIAIAFSFTFGNNPESKYVNVKDFQAVDISVGGSTSGDQIYFGNIKSLTSSYLVLDNVYYIPTSSTSTSNVTLEPLVCQIDTPLNQMVINRSSVNWWENLQPTSKVSTSINSYEKSNPKGPTCPTSASTTPATSSTTTK